MIATFILLAIFSARASAFSLKGLPSWPTRGDLSHHARALVTEATAAPVEPIQLSEEDEAFIAQQEPVTLEALTVDVSASERATGRLEPATLARAAGVLEAHGVVKLHGAWAAEPPLVEPIVDAIHDHYASLMNQVAAKGFSQDDAFGFNQIVHRSLGRYDMSLKGLVAFSRRHLDTGIPAGLNEESAGVQLMRVLLASPLWIQFLSHVLGPDYKTTITAALLARPGCAEQAPHCDGGHLFHSTHGFDLPSGSVSVLGSGSEPGDTGNAVAKTAAHVPAHALQLFLPMCDTPLVRGPTEFWPGSHLGKNAARAHLMPHRVVLEADAGDAVVFDFRVRHRGLANRSEEWRPILYQTCSRGWFTDDFNFPDSNLNDADGTAGGKGPPAAYESGSAGTRAGFIRKT